MLIAPVILEAIELLEMGYLAYKQVIAAKRVLDIAQSGLNYFTPAAESELKFHRQVLGEHGYMYLLGTEFISNNLREFAWTEDEKDKLALLAIAKTIATSGSADIRTNLITFGHAFGSVLQSYHPTVYDTLKAVEAKAYLGVKVQEPATAYVGTYANGRGSRAVNAMLALGVADDEWQALVKEFQSDEWTKRREAMEQSFNTKGLHRTSTFLALVIQGALNSRGHIPSAIPIFEGRDGFRMAPTPMLSLQGIRLPSRKIIHDRSITQEMVQMTSKRMMYEKGYVMLGDTSKNAQMWAPKSETHKEQIYDAKHNPIPGATQRVMNDLSSMEEAPTLPEHDRSALDQAIDAMSSTAKHKAAKAAEGVAEETLKLLKGYLSSRVKS